MIQSLKDDHPVNVLCDAPEVSRSGYYDWTIRTPSERELERERVIEQLVRSTLSRTAPTAARGSGMHCWTSRSRSTSRQSQST